tara:strand:- start:125 stop:265 length:141 start_codon:yes stop_codon:yes gene_type:complete
MANKCSNIINPKERKACLKALKNAGNVMRDSSYKDDKKRKRTTSTQ